MASWFSKLIDSAVDAQFRRDPTGRLVFVPFGLKKKCYFVDSKSDEEKIRALYKMYWSAAQLISLLTYPIIIFPGLLLEDYAGLGPWEHRMKIEIGIPLFFLLVLCGLSLMLWGLYKGAIPSFTSSLIEAGPDVKAELRPIILRSRRPLLVVCAVCLVLVGLGVVALVARSPICR